MAKGATCSVCGTKDELGLKTKIMHEYASVQRQFRLLKKNGELTEDRKIFLTGRNDALRALMKYAGLLKVEVPGRRNVNPLVNNDQKENS